MFRRCCVLCVVHGIRRWNGNITRQVATQSCIRTRKQIIFPKTYDTFQVRCYVKASDINIEYDELVSKLKQENITLIDVREPYELEDYGEFPKAINIPVGELAQALTLSPDAFKTVYGIEFPEEDDETVFACMAGVRSMRAAVIANLLGFTNSKNYIGGYYEWNEKTVETQT